MADHNLLSLESHILREEAAHPGSSGDFTWILSALSLAAKVIAAKVRRARIEDVLGTHGGINVHGEAQQKLDVLANEVLMACLGDRPSLSVVASEEHEEPTILRLESDGGKYCVIFDPLDGSSNLDVCAGRRNDLFDPASRSPACRPVAALCQPGSRQLAAGYILYGSSTVFVLTTGNGVDLFVLDPSIGSFVLVDAQDSHPAARPDVFGQRGLYPGLPVGHPAAISAGPTSTAIRAATSGRWSPTSIAPCLPVECSSIRRRRRILAASCGCSTKAIRWGC